ncbi:MAG TPA: SHOCT domain-containing protein [Micromonosporaceae bacterium]|nr:SHOCT domain-containing protein [Micromonosporaceae bacterium]
MHGYGWMWPMGGMMVGWLLLTILLVVVVCVVVASAGSRSTPDETGSARRVLAERYARGEMDTEEYHRRVAALR